MDLDFVRAQFPALDSDWAFLDNAGGSVPCRQVIERVCAHLERHPFQLGASYPASREAGEAVASGRRAVADLFGCDADEVVLGASSTVLAQQLATALCAGWSPGDEVIVTNLDHEANVGPWRRLEQRGIVVRVLRFREDDLSLHVEDLDALLSERTRLVAFTHCSNIVGSIVDVAALAQRARAAGALTCVDGVAYAPHRRVDVRALGVDFYLASLYKVYGPHLGFMYGRREALLAAKGSNHFFVSEESLPGKFEPGNPNYELAASLVGIREYLGEMAARLEPISGESDAIDRSFDAIARAEEALVTPLLGFLEEHPRTTVVGAAEADRRRRVPTVSFTVEGMAASELPPLLDERRIATRFGHFYAYALIEDLGLLERDGVVRVSLLHYNSPSEVDRLIEALDELL